MLCAALISIAQDGSPTPSAWPVPSASPTASARPTAAATPAASVSSPVLPSATPTPAPGGIPSPGASPSPAPTPVPYRYSYVPPASIPPSKILEIDLNDRRLQAPGDIRVRILTSSDVVSVIVRAMGREIAVPRVIQGVFAAQDKIPHVPFFLRGRTYDVEFVAASADGQSTTITLPIDLAR